jgi:hypothetical protein
LDIPVFSFGSAIPRSSQSSGQPQYSQGVTKVTKSFEDLLASRKELSRLFADKKEKDMTEQSAAVKKAHGIFRNDFDAVAFSEKDGYEKLFQSIRETHKVDESQVQDYSVGVLTKWDE